MSAGLAIHDQRGKGHTTLDTQLAHAFYTQHGLKQQCGHAVQIIVIQSVRLEMPRRHGIHEPFALIGREGCG